MTETVTIPVDELRDFLTRIFAAAGCDAENARMNAQGVIEADLRGHHIQGTDHIYSTVRELRAGRLNGRAKPKIVKETAATARVDGDGGTGHVTGVFATELATRKARVAGIGCVGLVGGGDIFMLGYYVEMIARAGLAGMTFTNTFPIRVHPAGGIDPLLGTNPLAFGFPVAGGVPIIVDLATSTSAIGHVRIASYKDKAIPAGIAINRHDTDDERQGASMAPNPTRRSWDWSRARSGVVVGSRDRARSAVHCSKPSRTARASSAAGICSSPLIRRLLVMRL